MRFHEVPVSNILKDETPFWEISPWKSFESPRTTMALHGTPWHSMALLKFLRALPEALEHLLEILQDGSALVNPLVL